jgi:hypothetical protein
MLSQLTDKPLFGPDDDVAGTCPTCGHRCTAKGRECKLVNAGFNERVPCVECPACRAKTPRTGGRAVPVARVPKRVLDFQI